MPKAPKWINDTVEALLNAKMPLLRVTETAYINSQIKRIRLHGNIKGLNFKPGYAIAVRINDTEYRNYTVSYNDAEMGLVELIAHLHGNGPGCRFMNDLIPGDEIKLIPPRGKKMYSEVVEQQFLFGDETSLALACALQSALQKGEQRYHFFFELDSENSNVPALLGLSHCTIVPKNNVFCDVNLVSELRLFQLPGWQQSNFILTGNARAVQTIRKTLKQNNITGSILTQAYWAEGKTGL